MNTKHGAVCGSLPPAVKGHLRGYLILTVPSLTLKTSFNCLLKVRVRWWGEVNKGVILQPEVCSHSERIDGTKIAACYTIRSAVQQFFAYLNDMHHLNLQIINANTSQTLANCFIDLNDLPNTKSIIGTFPVKNLDSLIVGELDASLIVDLSSDPKSSFQKKIAEKSKRNSNQRNYEDYIDNDHDAHIPKDLITLTLEKGRKLREEMIKALLEEENIAQNENNSIRPSDLILDNLLTNDFGNDILERSNEVLKLILNQEQEEISICSSPTSVSSISKANSDLTEVSYAESLIDEIFFKQEQFHSKSDSDVDDAKEKVTPSSSDHQLNEDFNYSELSKISDSNITKLPNYDMLLLISQARKVSSCHDLIYFSTKILYTNELYKSKTFSTHNLDNVSFSQILPVEVNEKLLARLKNNVIIIEVWTSEGQYVHEKLIGICKLPVNSLYLSLCALMKKDKIDNDFYIVACDSWTKVKNHLSNEEIGEIDVLLALGSPAQISSLKNNREEIYKHKILQATILEITFDANDTLAHYSFEFHVGVHSKVFIPEEINSGYAYVRYKFIEQSLVPQGKICSKVTYFESELVPSSTPFHLQSLKQHTFLLPDSHSFYSYLSNGLSPLQELQFQAIYSPHDTKAAETVVILACLPLSELFEIVTSTITNNSRTFNLPLKAMNNSNLHLGDEAKLIVKIKFSKLMDDDCKSDEKYVQTLPVKLRNVGVSAHENINQPVNGNLKTNNNLNEDLQGTPDHIPVEIVIERVDNLVISTSSSNEQESDLVFYISFNANQQPVYSPLVPFATPLIFAWTTATHFDLSRFTENLILKLWSKSEPSGDPDKMIDNVFGFVPIDLSPFLCGIRQLNSWYNIMDFSGNRKGQMKVSITPLSLLPSIYLFQTSTRNKPQYLSKENRQLNKRIEVNNSENQSDGINQVEEIAWNVIPTIEFSEDMSQSFLLNNVQKNLNDLELMQRKLMNFFEQNDVQENNTFLHPGATNSDQITTIENTEDPTINQLKGRLQKENIISTNHCNNVNNTVNITFHHPASETGVKLTQPEQTLNDDDAADLNSFAGTYDLLNKKVCVSNTDDEIPDFSAPVSQPCLEMNTTQQPLPQLDHLEESVRQLSQVLSNLCDSNFN